jgi:hypothetical protein
MLYRHRLLYYAGTMGLKALGGMEMELRVLR